MVTALVWLVTTCVVALCEGVVAQDDDYCNTNYYVPLADLALSCLTKEQPCMKEFKKTIRKAIKDGCLTAQDGVYARGDGTKVDIKEYMKSHWPYGTMNLPYVKDKGFSSSTREATYGMKSVQEKPHPSGDSSKNEKTVTEAFVHQRTTHTRKDATEGSHRHGNRGGDSRSSSSSESNGPSPRERKSSGGSRHDKLRHSTGVEKETKTIIETETLTTAQNEEQSKKNLGNSDAFRSSENGGQSSRTSKAMIGSRHDKKRHSKEVKKETYISEQTDKLATVQQKEQSKKKSELLVSSSEDKSPLSLVVKESDGSRDKHRKSTRSKKGTSTVVETEKSTTQKEERSEKNRGRLESSSSSEDKSPLSYIKASEGSARDKRRHSKGGKKKTSAAVETEQSRTIQKEERLKKSRDHLESSSSSEDKSPLSYIKAPEGSGRDKHQLSKEGKKQISTAVETEKLTIEEKERAKKNRGQLESSSSSEIGGPLSVGVKESRGSRRDKHAHDPLMSSSSSSSSDSSDVEAVQATAGSSRRERKHDKSATQSASYFYNQASNLGQGSQTASQGEQAKVTSDGQGQKVRSQKESQSQTKAYSEDNTSDSSSDRKRSSHRSSKSRKEKVTSNRSSKMSSDYTASTRSEDAAVNGETSSVVKSKSQSKKKKSKQNQSSTTFSDQHDSGEEGRGTQDDPGLTTIDHESTSSNTRTKIRLGGEGSTNIRL